MNWKQYIVYFRLSLVIILIFGISYPLVMTGVTQLLFTKQANGSMLTDKTGKVIGSELIGQQFTDAKYFKGRLSSIDYDASNSGSNNYGPSNPQMLTRTEKAAEHWIAQNAGRVLSDIPMDLITNSGSGLDPHISVRAAKFQIPIVSRANNIPHSKLEQLVNKYTEHKHFGFLGEAKVNVLKLNLALQELLSQVTNF